MDGAVFRDEDGWYFWEDDGVCFRGPYADEEEAWERWEAYQDELDDDGEDSPRLQGDGYR